MQSDRFDFGIVIMTVAINARIYEDGFRDGMAKAAKIADERMIWFAKLENALGADYALGASSVAFCIRSAITKVDG